MITDHAISEITTRPLQASRRTADGSISTQAADNDSSSSFNHGGTFLRWNAFADY